MKQAAHTLIAGCVEQRRIGGAVTGLGKWFGKEHTTFRDPLDP